MASAERDAQLAFTVTADAAAGHTSSAPHDAQKRAVLDDLRFRTLLGKDAWDSLPAAIRRRFSKRVSQGMSILYRGRVTGVRFSLLGRLLAELLRPLGAPLPLSNAVGLATAVTVTEDLASGGQVWSRLFVRPSGFPQVIQSVKRFAGPTGLEEAIGFGIVMSLALSAEPGRLVFRSAGYGLTWGRHRLSIPAYLTPGALTVTHEEITDREFRFTLTLAHPLFGELIFQDAAYAEVPS